MTEDTTTTHFDLTRRIVSYEEGECSYEEYIELFQFLVNTGFAWQLQGSYGRTARDLIQAGEITMKGQDD